MRLRAHQRAFRSPSGLLRGRPVKKGFGNVRFEYQLCFAKCQTRKSRPRRSRAIGKPWSRSADREILLFHVSSRFIRESSLMRGCVCGRTRELSDRPLDSFGAVPFIIGPETESIFSQRHFTRYQTRRHAPEGSRDSERPENCPGDSFQRRMGGSPGSIGKPLARSAERESPPIWFFRTFRDRTKKKRLRPLRRPAAGDHSGSSPRMIRAFSSGVRMPVSTVRS